MLSVVMGAGSVKHEDSHAAKLFSKRHRKGIVERDFYHSAAEALVGGKVEYAACEGRGMRRAFTVNPQEDGGLGLTSISDNVHISA